ncbi:Hsp70 family protein [Rhodococcus sp. BP-252]|uniref:Hsp70 family protein n=1 Tax=unclassified Rhodococcus (in: high G+C Gram-positive bacteria) TaxID=192944 RepID=UPI001C9A517A|nr:MULTISPECIES: Hsp70 family protein [unclassified Rhodococcus (in: high G+C Gram-positive bacteria)]MBY6412208.1 Hsp70 family protein [Rhodococcus sp. BP-320]MBY6416788.1 Hsp70 family protein [Rhodococcus sp. BP-321]MBY6421674.1 Hsp70 family protein [Rhodococcus sp. BP-324]MBY6426940.1 Hsp70 family protein [Rhodococcus sp. BP-323]MBY6432106.1 Hsp70 family protein [Rhodococcus sp. BP-322]
MSAGLGIRIGTITSVAVRSDSHDPHAPRDYATDEAMPTVTKKSALDLRPGAAPSLANTGERSPRHLLSGFADRVGDPVPLIDDDGRSHQAEDLFATAARVLVAEVSAGAESDAAVVLTHPDRWSGYTVDTLRDALGRAGVPDATLVTDSVSSMRWLESMRGASGDGLVVVYDLGASSLDVTLMRTGVEQGALGPGVHSTDFGGAQFDHLITQYVLETVSSSHSFDFDPFDPDTVGALVELRARCGEAKEQLSYETATTLSVDLPGFSAETRLVRDEVEDLLRRPILDSIELVRETLHTTGLDISDVTQVLLIGGSSSIPLVAELISSELRVPVVTGPHPDRIPAIGAALFGAEIAAASVAEAPTAAAVAVTRPAPRPAPVMSTAAADEGRMSGRKRAGIVVASVAALAVLAGGGLSLGTALTSNDAPADAAVVSTTTPSTTTAPGTTAATVADSNGTATTSNGLPAPTVAADGTLIPAPGTVIAPDGTVVADPAAPAATGTPGAPAPNVAVPDVSVPSVSVPSPQAPTYTAPTYTPPTYNGPTLGDVGTGVGGAVSDLGTGVGGLTGGVVDGLGNVVGGVTGPLLGN